MIAVYGCAAVCAAENRPPYTIEVLVSKQVLVLRKNGEVFKSYPVSTSKYGIGNQEGSRKTPLGKHRIAKKVGHGAEIHTIFKDRRHTGKTVEPSPDPVSLEGDFITTRVLWLQGLEPGLNRGGRVDSYRRFIYIHGTPEEGLIGRPASHGCIRMKNADVIELFDIVGEGTSVVISP